jgi:PEP-CTERM motif
MRVTIKTIAGLTSLAGLLIGSTAIGQVINGGFESASGAYTTGALGWNDFSAPANNGSTASATRSLLDPFAGVAELTLTYQNSANPGIGPSVIAQSDIFGGVSAGNVTLQFEAEHVVAGTENNQVQMIWFSAGNIFNGSSGFVSYNPTLTPAYSLQSISWVAPANTVAAQIQFLTAGGAVANDTATVRIDNVVVPEPATLSLAALGLLGVWAFRRSRKA